MFSRWVICRQRCLEGQGKGDQQDDDGEYLDLVGEWTCLILLITEEGDGEDEKGGGGDDDDDDAQWYKQEVGEEPDPGKCPPCHKFKADLRALANILFILFIKSCLATRGGVVLVQSQVDM